MTILYSNGCSFTDNRWLLPKYRYPFLIGKHLDWEVVPAAVAGSCNSRIIRCTIRDCIELLKRKMPITALIQLTYLERFEYAGTPVLATRWKYARADEYESVKPTDLDGLSADVVQWTKLSSVLFKNSAAWSQLYSSLVGLISFFKLHNISYYIYAGPDLQPVSIRDHDFYNYIANDPNVLDFRKFNMLDLTGQQTHPDIEGMQTIADYFIKLLFERE